MKKKDIVSLVIAVVILMAAGYIAYTQLLSPKQTATGETKGATQVDVIGAIPASLDSAGLATLNDPTKTVDYTPQIDLTTGLGNPTPFGN
ncbi:hypothetical protein HJC99_01885 [Candidatus Saccharibacteria bacterium]|nr:hypothetical protein [Candidatus Saccharibacteria bacterium]